MKKPNIMKNLLFALALLVSFSSLGQDTLLEDIDSIYPNDVEGYFDKNDDLLFEGKAQRNNIGDFKNHTDFKKISYLGITYFKGDYFSSDGANIKYFCDSNGSPSSIMSFMFKSWNEKTESSSFVGTQITYFRYGGIESIIHY